MKEMKNFFSLEDLRITVMVFEKLIPSLHVLGTYQQITVVVLQIMQN